MADFLDEINTAYELINELEKSITISGKRNEAYNPVTGTSTFDTVSMTIKAGVLPASAGKLEGMDIRFRIGSLGVIKQAVFIIISGKDLAFIPELTDTIMIGSEEYNILALNPVNPNNGDPIIYKIAAQR